MVSHPVTLEMFYAAAWQAVPLYSDPAASLTRGLAAYGSWPNPTKITATINNDTLAYDPSRPESTLYGIAGRNIPVRIRYAGGTRSWAEASVYEPDRTVEHVPGTGRGRSDVQLTAEGVLRRLGKWTDPLRSPMFRTISARAASIGHWSLEDSSDAANLANSLAAGLAGTHRGITLGESESPLGAAQTARSTTGSQMTGKFAGASITAGWQIGFAMRLSALPSSATYQVMFRWRTSNGNDWFWDVNNASYRVNVRDPDGTLLYTSLLTFGAGAEPDQWVNFRFMAKQTGGNVDVNQGWYAQQGNAYVDTGSFVGSVGGLKQWWAEGNGYTDNAHFSHVFGLTGIADDLLSSTNRKVFDGYTGETAMARYSRLTLELGIRRYVLGTSAETQPMGPQRSDTLINLLKQCRDTEDGEIYDEPNDQPSLTMRSRRYTYAQAAALTLQYPSQVAVPFRKIIGDDGVHNAVTIKNASGAELTMAQTTGPMSTQPPPAGVGEYKETVDVSVANEATQLDYRATWELAKGTLERARYASVTVDLVANPALRAAAEAVNLMQRIDVIGAEPEPVRLLVRGYEDQLGRSERTITYFVEPYEPWDVGIWDDPTFRYDSPTTTLAAARDAVQTSWSLTTAGRADVWTTNPAMYPLDLMAAGERVRVTAMTAPAGTGPYTQTATVTRSVNGVVKAQSAGTAVSLADPKRWGY